MSDDSSPGAGVGLGILVGAVILLLILREVLQQLAIVAAISLAIFVVWALFTKFKQASPHISPSSTSASPPRRSPRKKRKTTCVEPPQDLKHLAKPSLNVAEAVPGGNTFRDQLCNLIRNYSPSVCDDPRRCEALIRDLCPPDQNCIHLVVCALTERAPAELLASRGKQPTPVVIARLQKRLQDNLSITEDAACWAVQTWALALGVISKNELTI